MMLTNITSKVQQSTFFPIMPRQPRGRLCLNPHNLPKLLRIFHTITLSPQSPCRESPPPPYPPPLPPFCPKAFRMPSLMETPPPGEWSSNCFVHQEQIFIVLALQGSCSKDLWIAVETTKTDITREEVHDGI